MKDYNKLYYTENTVWNRYLDLDSIPKFNNVRYGDTIIFHFSLVYSITKVFGQYGKLDKSTFVGSINICLRYYQIIKKLYPHNDVRIIIHVDNLGDPNTAEYYYSCIRAISDLIPYVAVTVGYPNVINFDCEKVHHIYYGKTVNLKYSQSMKFTVVKGHLIAKMCN